MKIEKDKVVVLTYELEVDGEIADRASEERPLDYIHGTHMLLPKFEAEVDGLSEGDNFSFTLTPEEGYGPYDEAKVIELPKSAFTVEGVLREDLMEIGRTLPMMGKDGGILYATVKEVTENGVIMDFNDRMAGKTLNFKGTILSVRDATEKELREGLHGEYLPPEEGHRCCHGKGKGHCHKHGEGHCHEGGEGHCHEHKDGEGCCHEGGEGCCHDKD